MRFLISPLAAAAAACLLAVPALAQGAGSTGLEVAQVPSGARAGALAGAYTAVRGDADAVFFNPAAIVGIGSTASLSYQRHVMDIAFGSVAGTFQVGRVSVGGGFAFMDGGEVPEFVPDPDFGGQRGRPTGATVSARESVLRLAAGAPVLDGRVFLGGSAGLALSEIAGVSRSAPFVDLGAHARVAPRASVGLVLRNLGGALSGDGAEDADLPLEARLGGVYQLPLPSELGLLVTADVVNRVREEIIALAGGVEFGLMPADGAVGAVVRAGYLAESAVIGSNALHLGAGVSFAGIGLDYQYQNLEFFGPAHRIGVRWRGR